MEDTTKFKGELTIESYKDGKLVRKQTFHNEIVDLGAQFLGDILSGENLSNYTIDRIQFASNGVGQLGWYDASDRNPTFIGTLSDKFELTSHVILNTSIIGFTARTIILSTDLSRPYVANLAQLLVSGNTDTLFSVVSFPEFVRFHQGETNIVSYTLKLL